MSDGVLITIIICVTLIIMSSMTGRSKDDDDE